MFHQIGAIDWQAMFVPSMSLAEVVLRGSVMYLAILTLFRLMRREAGAVGVSDLLVVVLIADAAQNGMAGEYRSITEGVVLIMTIVGWDVLIDWLGYRYAAVGWLLTPPPLVLIEKGRLNRRNMRHELVTEDELMSHLRRAGIERIDEVKICHMEPNGEISVIKHEGMPQPLDDQKGI